MKSTELLQAVDEALAQCGSLLNADDRARINSTAVEVRTAMNALPHDVKLLKAANQALDDATQSLAVMLVERAMELALERKLS